MWSPEGFFTCSTNGEKILGYHLNQGPDKTPKFVTSDQFYDQFYRCDLVSWHLKDRLAKEVTDALRQGDIRQVLTNGLPPTLDLPGSREVRQKEREFPVEVKITDQGGGIGRLVYRVNDVALETRSVAGIVLPGRRDTTVTANLPLVAGKNIITVTAYNSRGQVESQPVSKTVYVEEPAERPCLYGLIIGINSYRSSPLKYAADDALALKDELEKRSRGLFSEIKLKLLQNSAASRKAIQDAFQELAP